MDIICNCISGPLRGEGCSSELIGLVEVSSRSQVVLKKALQSLDLICCLPVLRRGVDGAGSESLSLGRQVACFLASCTNGDSMCSVCITD